MLKGSAASPRDFRAACARASALLAASALRPSSEVSKGTASRGGWFAGFRHVGKGGFNLMLLLATRLVVNGDEHSAQVACSSAKIRPVGRVGRLLEGVALGDCSELPAAAVRGRCPLN